MTHPQDPKQQAEAERKTLITLIANLEYSPERILGLYLTGRQVAAIADFILAERREHERTTQAQVAEARQEPVGDAVEVKVPVEVMKHVLSFCKQSDATIASRVLLQEREVQAWRTEGAELEIWRLKIIASLTKRFNWTVFLLTPENLPKKRAAQINPQKPKQEQPR